MTASAYPLPSTAAAASQSPAARLKPQVDTSTFVGSDRQFTVLKVANRAETRRHARPAALEMSFSKKASAFFAGVEARLRGGLKGAKAARAQKAKDKGEDKEPELSPVPPPSPEDEDAAGRNAAMAPKPASPFEVVPNVAAKERRGLRRFLPSGSGDGQPKVKRQYQTAMPHSGTSELTYSTVPEPSDVATSTKSNTRERRRWGLIGGAAVTATAALIVAVTQGSDSQQSPQQSSVADEDGAQPSASGAPTAGPSSTAAAPTSEVPAPSPAPAPAPTPGPADLPAAEAQIDSFVINALITENAGITPERAQALLDQVRSDPAAAVETIRTYATINQSTPVTNNLALSVASRCTVDSVEAGNLAQAASCDSFALWTDKQNGRANVDLLANVETSLYNGQAPTAQNLSDLNALTLGLSPLR